MLSCLLYKLETQIVSNSCIKVGNVLISERRPGRGRCSRLNVKRRVDTTCCTVTGSRRGERAARGTAVHRSMTRPACRLFLELPAQ